MRFVGWRRRRARPDRRTREHEECISARRGDCDASMIPARWDRIVRDTCCRLPATAIFAKGNLLLFVAIGGSPGARTPLERRHCKGTYNPAKGAVASPKRVAWMPMRFIS